MICSHAGQVLVAGFTGHEPSESLLRRARAGRLGGFILFRRNVIGLPQLVDLNHRLRSAFADTAPPFLTLDQEGGRVARVPAPVLQLPAMRVLADFNDLALTREVARVLSVQLKALGFNLNMAPVLDVDTNPGNPVIGDRSFGASVDAVVAQARALAQGMAAAGLASCGKHFPGHGDTELDSHLSLPRVRHGATRLEQVEIAPFAALTRELPAIMTAHIVFDALDPDRPATLSRTIATGLLRERLGFEGVLISDDLEMRAITDHQPPGQAAVAAVDAGCDTLLVCSDEDRLEHSYEALVRRAEADAAFASRLAEAAERSLAMRRRFPSRVTAPPDPGPQFERQSGPLQSRLAGVAA